MGPWSARTTLAAAETVGRAGGASPAAGTSPTAGGPPSRRGRYQIERLLGEGAMGRVYRAHDPVRGRAVAVKVIKEPHCHDEKAMKRFLREAEAVSRLSHPGLVGVLDTGPDFIVLDLVEGESLDSLIGRRGALPPAEALGILERIADALDHIHAHGIVHRDVKPSNILVSPDGGVRLTDFGVAHLSWAPMTRTGELLGSPAYMAPEQIALGDVEPASDVHALGVVAWEALVGRRPFEASTLAELLLKVTSEEPPSAHRARPSLPPGVDDVLRQALAKDPDDRFLSARDLVDALAAALAPRRRAGAGFRLACLLLPVLALVRGGC
jgi:serine/threonine protein kinase